MHIDRINSRINNSYRTVFKAYDRAVYDNVTHRYKCSTTTSFFRNDLAWDKLVDFLICKYKNIDIVNTYSCAGSDGEEAYSLALSFFERGKECEKFIPIIAGDIDFDNIKRAESGIFVIDKKESEQMVKYLKNPMEKYFTVMNESPSDLTTDLTVFIKPELRKLVSFVKSDITRDYADIPPENSVVLCRNVFPYLGQRSGYILVKNFAKHLKPSSLLIIGAYDERWGYGDRLLNSGFRKTSERFVYEKE